MSDLPSSWEMADGDDLFASVRGVTYSKADAASAPADGFVPILRANNIADGRIVADDLVYVPAKYVSPEQYLRAGDLLIATSSGSRTVVGKAAAASDEHRRYAFGAFCTVARPRVQEFGDWLSRFARARAYRDYVEQVALGISINNLRGSDLKSIPIRLAPLPEQRRIVAKIDSLTGKSRRARDHLDHIPRLVEKYKQAVLAAAFRGDLTREWRTSGAIVDGTWDVLELGKVADIGTGATPKRGTSRYYDGGAIPWVTSGAVNEEIVRGSEECITATALRETNCQLYPVGTLLLAMYGEGKTRGKVAVLGIEAATNQALAAIVVHQNGPAEPEFVLWYLRSQYLELREQAAGGVQPNLNLGIIKRTRLPLPSRIEQREIVERLVKAFSWIDRLASEVTSARRLIDRLDQSILAKAFRGELVPQEPADEPASVLLDRIRAERTNAPKPRRVRKSAAGA